MGELVAAVADARATRADAYVVTTHKQACAGRAGFTWEVRSPALGTGLLVRKGGWCAGPRREASAAARQAVLELRAAAERPARGGVK